MEDKKYTQQERIKLNRELKPQGKRCCPDCDEVKPLEEFLVAGKLKSGELRYRVCYPCNRIKNKKFYNPEKKAKYHEENKERIQEYRKQYYQDNKEKSATDSKRWREENKEHLKEYRQKMWLENKEELSKKNKQYWAENAERISEQRKQYYQENKERLSEQKKEYYQENREQILEEKRKYREENREHMREMKNKRYHERLKTDKLFEIKESIRKCIYGKIKNKKFTTCEILGCDYETLKVHIENQFQEGMTWDNHGQFGWHYDHIIPSSSAKTEEELYQLNHYTNFQPLWWRDNLSKNTKLDWEQVED